MPTPNYEQIQSFGNVSRKLIQAAINEFMRLYDESMPVDEIVSLMSTVGRKYGLLGSELGAQWYDLCSKLANIDAEPAELKPLSADATAKRAVWYLENSTSSQQAIASYFHNVIQESIRTTGSDNLWRDYKRGIVSGKWARVPIGDTCAFCIMLASQGAWYVSEESALGKEAGHYHDGCDCIAVYHADPNNIPNYPDLIRYKEMYYDAENARIANENGTQAYDDDLQERIDRARAQHRQSVEDGETDVPWSRTNETLIVMRYQNHLK